MVVISSHSLSFERRFKSTSLVTVWPFKKSWKVKSDVIRTFLKMTNVTVIRKFVDLCICVSVYYYLSLSLPACVCVCVCMCVTIPVLNCTLFYLALMLHNQAGLGHLHRWEQSEQEIEMSKRFFKTIWLCFVCKRRYKLLHLKGFKLHRSIWSQTN